MTEKRSLKILFFTVFLDLVGFGIIIPLIPYLADEFKATPLEIGLLMAVFSFMQFLFSPFWGKLSDYFGRRPIILTSLLGSTFSYILFAYSQTLEFLFVARTLAGFFASNISTVQACIADITPKEKRSVGMGLIGAAFGLGFIMGPVIAGVSGSIGEALGDTPPFGIQFSSLVAGGLNACNFLLAFFILPETYRPNLTEKRESLKSLSFIFKQSSLGTLLGIFFLISLAMALMEVMIFPFVKERFDWNYKLAAISFAYVGVIMVLTQGYYIRQLIPLFGEKKTLFFGLLAMTLSFLMIGLSFHVPTLGLAMTLLAVGNGCMRPPIIGLISVITDEKQQGYVLGIMSSIGAIGRIVGPVIGGWLYQEFSQGTPFFASGLLAMISVFLFAGIARTLPNPRKKGK